MSKRSVRREAARASDKLARDLEKLALVAPGGSPSRPLIITSPSEVEPTSRGTPCPVCTGELRVEDHTAETLGGARLRVAQVACATCGRRRKLYFQLKATVSN